jgi:uncharacterized membrane protein
MQQIAASKNTIMLFFGFFLLWIVVGHFHPFFWVWDGY